MEIAIISVAAFLISILTFFSGFGLGTLLTPVFMFFFPIEIAIALTGVVHFFNNIFKLLLVGRHADKNVVLQFGIPAVVFAVIGSWLLLHISGLQPLFSYHILGRDYSVTPVNLVISALLMIFAVLELVPWFGRLQFSSRMLPAGGALSGFFGGLSGVQGALRSAFLIKAGLSKEAFIATAVVVSTFVDITRLSMYAANFAGTGLSGNLFLVVSATLSGIVGAYIGNRLLKKVTLKSLQKIVAIMLILISLALGSGIV